MLERMKMRLFYLAVLPLACAALSACEGEASDSPREVLTQDPQLARALNDPLMVDPDLAWRTEANAVIAFRDGHPLPPFEARSEAADRAREAARLELLEFGQIPSLPNAVVGGGGVSLAEAATANAMIRALDARPDCSNRLTDDLLWSTRMPDTSSLMPHAMVQQAAGVDVGTCVIRVVRYLVPVGIEDALEYHFTKIDRARFDITRYDAPEAQIVGERRDQVLSVNVRPGPGGMTAVDLVHWRK